MQPDSQFLELDVTNVAHGGVFIARHEGRVVFVSDAIPGERVRARVRRQKSSFWEADTVEVLSASEHRRDHVWASASVDRDPAERAGGAEFGHIALAHQRSLKETVVTEALSRFAGIDLPVTVSAVPGDDAANGLGWRTRVSLQVDDAGRVGPYAAGSHTVIEVPDLPLAHADIAAQIPRSGVPAGTASIDILRTSGGETRVSLRAQQRRRGRAPVAAADAPTIVETVGGREFRLAENGFWQVHHGAAQVLTEAVQNAVNRGLFDPAAGNLDLYGGVGLLAAALGDRFGAGTRITSVEASERATTHAGENLAEWVGARAQTGRVDQFLDELLATAGGAARDRIAAGTVVLDPPRAGAGKRVVEQLVELAPAQLIYVACDPVALARDLGQLTAAGYTLTGVTGHDLFPHTHHVEAVASLVRTDLA
ncbi:class I SAM-dependent RNA methyltransferase [Mycetocola tolaasinivorans]|uniref:Class I SAM-dependent RNA methyltransferase n=1 Tax=Mycetocola tolaasinivorans TaxID=76635 RepID=A0A3L7A8Q0_9MICO|nr:class I SAM-dependent RNA methyltransferase [Mycetocola tolaasinivorans]